MSMCEAWVESDIAIEETLATARGIDKRIVCSNEVENPVEGQLCKVHRSRCYVICSLFQET